MKVLFFTEGFTPATRFRVLQYLPSLRHHGIDGTVSYFRDAAFPMGGVSGPRSYGLAVRDIARRCRDVLTASRYDAVCFQRDLVPWNTDILERIGARLNRRVVFDFDDAIYLSPCERVDRTRKITSILQRVRMAMVANHTLQAFASPWAETALVPMAVDTDHFVPAEVRGERRPVRIGWIGTPTNVRHLAEVRAALRVLAARGDVEFLVMSNRDAIPELDGIPTRVEPWSETGERALLQRLDIGLLPLADTPWTRGKFPIKLLQYMAVGAVPVCSPVGVVTDVVKDGVNGCLVPSRDAWITTLQRLIEDGRLRQRLGATARQTVEQGYSVRAVLPRLLDVFETVCT